MPKHKRNNKIIKVEQSELSTALHRFVNKGDVGDFKDELKNICMELNREGTEYDRGIFEGERRFAKRLLDAME